MLQVQLLGEVQRPFWQAGEQVASTTDRRGTFVGVHAASSLAVYSIAWVKELNVLIIYES